MKALLVMNPGSRAGRGQRLWSMWERGLREASVAFECVTTSRLGDALEAARKATAYDTVVAVGGDGTINEVLDGVVQSGRDGVRMGVLYSGTSPDFCRFHGIPVAPEAAVRALVSGRTQRVDVGRIVYRTDGGRTSGAAATRGWARRWRGWPTAGVASWATGSGRARPPWPACWRWSPST